MAPKSDRAILLINPNTTEAMTVALKPLVNTLGLESTRVNYFTAPSGVPSINNEDDAGVSAEACLPALRLKLTQYDGFLVCCYSQHPLVPQLRSELDRLGAGGKGKVVTGIFEASVAACLQSIHTDAKFGIVSTGAQWEEILNQAVANLLGSVSSSRYAGTETTGLHANELHSTSKAEVDKRMKHAVKRGLGKNAKAICLGCAGMAGMDQVVREACVEQLGVEAGNKIKVIDGVVSGTMYIESALRIGY